MNLSKLIDAFCLKLVTILAIFSGFSRSDGIEKISDNSISFWFNRFFSSFSITNGSYKFFVYSTNSVVGNF